MQRLRRQVDQIDLKLLSLLQKRIKIAGQIGLAKRRHGAEIYVPGRERELLGRMTRLADGKIPGSAVSAIFREILSSSRAAQGQAPIGLLRKDEKELLFHARCYFGACDEFVPQATWGELEAGIREGKLSFALVSAGSLPGLRASEPKPSLIVSGELQVVPPLPERVFIVKSRGESLTGTCALILIGKSTPDAVKSLVSAMPFKPVHLEQSIKSPSRGGWMMLHFASCVSENQVTPALPASAQLLGLYTPNEDYGR